MNGASTRGINGTSIPAGRFAATASVSWLLRPGTYVLTAALLRALALLLVPYISLQLAIPGLAENQGGAVIGYEEGLRHRVNLHPFTEDETAYDEMARNLVAGRGFVLDSQWLITTPGEPAMYAGCLYPLFVAAIYRAFGSGEQVPVFVTQILLAAVGAYFIFWTAQRVAGHQAGALAAAYYAAHPGLIWSSLAMMSEAVTIPVMAFVMWLLVCRPPRWRRGALLGVSLAGLSLARSTFAHFVLATAGLLILERRSWRGWARRLAPACACLVVFALCVTPWAVRNYVHWGRLIPLSTKSGAGAWMWNHPGLVVEFGPRAFEAPKPVDVFDAEVQSLPNEAERDAKLMRLFIGFVTDQPMKFAGLVLVRTAMAILPVSVSSEAHGGSIVATVSAWYIKGIPLLALIAAAMFLRARLWWRMLPLALFALYWLLMQALAGPGLRYRIPADPVWACIVGVIAASTLVRIWPRARGGPLARRWVRAGTAPARG